MKKIYLLMIALSLTVCGCAPTEKISGNEVLNNSSLADLEQKIHKHITTKQEIIVMFGKPNGISRSAGLEIYSYTSMYKRQNEYSVNKIKSKMLSITFKNDIVESYIYSKNDM